MYYFGCWRLHTNDGHRLYRPEGSSAWRLLMDGGLPWTAAQIDTGLCPHGVGLTAQQPEGAALLHHKKGWTALAFWDRSADRRRNSNSVQQCATVCS